MKRTKIVFNPKKKYRVRLAEDIECCLSISGVGRCMVQNNGIEVLDFNDITIGLSCGEEFCALTQREELSLQELIAEGIKNHDRFVKQLQCPKKMAQIFPDLITRLEAQNFAPKKAELGIVKAKEVVVVDLKELITRFVAIEVNGADARFCVDKEAGIEGKININHLYTNLKVIADEEGTIDKAYAIYGKTDISFVFIDKHTGKPGRQHYIPVSSINDLLSMVVAESKFIEVNIETGEVKIKAKKFLKQLKKHLKGFIKFIVKTSDLENLDDIEVE